MATVFVCMFFEAVSGSGPATVSAIGVIIPPSIPFVIIIGGIYGGIFTPTEAAVFAVMYSLVIGPFIFT
jgi:C4-dicarboxylate transporter DctM subunit